MKQVKKIFFVNIIFGFLSSFVLLIPIILYLIDYTRLPSDYSNLMPATKKNINLPSSILIAIVFTISSLIVWYYQIRKLLLKSSDIKFVPNDLKYFVGSLLSILLTIIFFLVAFFCIWLFPFASDKSIDDFQIQQLALWKLIIYLICYFLILTFLVISQLLSYIYSKKHIQQLTNKTYAEN